MKKLAYCYLMLTILSINVYGQWETKYSNSNYYINSVWFLNQDTGFFVTGNYGSKGLICKTINGGKSWTTVNSGNNEGLTDICFINQSVGFAIGKTIISNMYYGIILKTINGGESWSIIWTGNSSVPAIPNLEKVFFTDSLTGYVTVNGGSNNNQILKTIDGGKSWLSINLNNEGSELFFLNNDTGFVASISYLQKTTDGGISWTSNSFPGLSAIFFLDDKIGFGLSGYSIEKTIDGGLSWEKKYTASSDNFYSISFINDSVGYAFGNIGYIYKTLDGGENWIIQDKPTSNRIHKSFFINNCIGYAVGTGGTVLKTINGGLVKPKLKFSPSTTICEGDTCILNINANTDYFKYYWSSGLLNDTLFAIKSDKYYLKIENSSGCSVISDTSEIIVNETPKVNLSLVGNTIYAETKSSGKTFEWYSKNQLLKSSQDSSFTVKTNGTYKVIATSSFGCIGISDTIVVNNTEIQSLSELGVEIFPNPTNNIVYFKTIKPVLFNLYDINGLLVKTINSNIDNSIIISEQGIYLLEILTEKNKGYQKIIVQ